MSRADQRDAMLARRMLFGTSVIAAFAVAMIVLAAVTSLPVLSEWVSVTFNDGIGLRTAALVAVIVSVVVLVVFALVAGEGLIGEIQFMIPAFFLFFVFFWLMLAWIF